jgi:osmoprotectant transport system substrate-binding protein
VQTTVTRKVLAAVLALAMPVSVGACGGDDDGGGDQPGAGKPAITIGSKSFTEQTILGQLYAQALRAKGYRVTLKANIGQTEIADKALTSGQVDMYPEYTGTTLSVVARQTTKPKNEQEAYQQARAFYERRGQTMTQPTPFYNSDALAVLRPFGQRNQLRSVADLRKLGSRATIAGAPEFRTREEGLVGLRRVYGLDQIGFRPLAIGLQYRALDSGDVNVAEVFTTDGQLDSGKYTVLEDPRRVFGFQNVAMVLPRRLLQRLGPDFAETVNAVSAKLTVEAMREMNAAVDINKQSAQEVARRFLEANNLL